MIFKIDYTGQPPKRRVQAARGPMWINSWSPSLCGSIGVIEQLPFVFRTWMTSFGIWTPSRGAWSSLRRRCPRWLLCVPPLMALLMWSTSLLWSRRPRRPLLRRRLRLRCRADHRRDSWDATRRLIPTFVALRTWCCRLLPLRRSGSTHTSSHGTVRSFRIWSKRACCSWLRLPRLQSFWRLASQRSPQRTTPSCSFKDCGVAAFVSSGCSCCFRGRSEPGFCTVGGFCVFSPCSPRSGAASPVRADLGNKALHGKGHAKGGKGLAKGGKGLAPGGKGRAKGGGVEVVQEDGFVAGGGRTGRGSSMERRRSRSASSSSADSVASGASSGDGSVARILPASTGPSPHSVGQQRRDQRSFDAEVAAGLLQSG